MFQKFARLAFVLALAISSACGGHSSPTSPSPGPEPGTPPITGGPTLGISTTALPFAYGVREGELVVTVEGGKLPWAVTGLPEWLSAEPSSGELSTTVKVTAKDGLNPSYVQDRVGTFSIGGKVVTVTQAPRLAVAPAGMPQGLWVFGFCEDGTMCWPEAVHLILSAEAKKEAKESFSRVMAVIKGYNLGTPMDLVAGGPGANIPVKVTSPLTCGSWGLVGACTSLERASSGAISGGLMEFSSGGLMEVDGYVLYEALRTLGTSGFSPIPGGFFSNPSIGMEPNALELALLRARRAVPNGAVCGKDEFTPCIVK